MKVGFTGTRDGMSPSQMRQLSACLKWLTYAAIFIKDRRQNWNEAAGKVVEPIEPLEFHFGTHETVELKADAQAAAEAEVWGFTLVPHPASAGTELARDREVVAAVEILIAAPKSHVEVLRSGTWATVRYARAAGLPVLMLSRSEKGSR